MRLSPPKSDPLPSTPPPTARTPLARIWRIHDEIEAGNYPNCRKLAALLEVSEKTVGRDIEFMRSRLELPIAYHEQKFGYYYTEKVGTMLSLDVSEGELVSLLIAQNAIKHYRGTSFEAPLHSACDKIAKAMRGRVSVNLAELSARIVFRAGSTPEVDPAIFAVVAQAVRESRVLEFEYKKLLSEEWEYRILRPYHLACVKDFWYAIGFDEWRGAIRTFALTRMRMARLGERLFERPADFSLEKHLEHSLGVFTVDEPSQTVRIRFLGWAAQLVRERVWHSSQKIREMENGDLEWEAHLSSMQEVQRWVLSFGVHARVLEPSSLVDRMREVAGKLAACYGEVGLL
jgi:predicted DNA-binding transcriptional regulator YafY